MPLCCKTGIIAFSLQFLIHNTGYFNVEKTYYTAETDFWRNMLTLNNSQGQIVAIFIDMDHMVKVIKNGNRNAENPALECDPFLYIDGRNEATMLGTGLEDYFVFAHYFEQSENTSYAFTGNFQCRHHFPFGTTVTSFRSIQESESSKLKHKQLLQNYAEALKYPENHGPDKGQDCMLQCIKLGHGHKKGLIYTHQKSGVITAIQIRVFQDITKNATLLQNWNNSLLTAIFDS